MRLKTFVMAVTILMAGLAAAVTAVPSAGAAEAYLLGVHTRSGLTCTACHGSDAPTRAAPSTSCLQCHGPYAQLAERTKALEVNPHKSHLGDVDCLNCHGVHAKVDEEKVPCLSCHGDFEFKLK